MKNLLAFAALSTMALSALPAHAEPDLKTLLPKFEAYASKAYQDWEIPGMAIAIVVDDQVVYSKGFGVREVGKQEPVTPETVFQIGSISKSFTASLVAMLVDEKKIDWADRVVNTLDHFAMHDPWVTHEFTVEDTMSQRSGMEPYAGDLLAFLGHSRKEMVRAIRHIPPVSSVRTRFAYVNNLWLVAAELIEAKTAKSWEDNMTSRIFQPLGMSSSSTGMEGLYGVANHATPHQRDLKGLMPLHRDWPFAEWVYTYGPAGGVNSNVLDMTRYARLHLQGKVDGKEFLKRETVDYLHSPHIFAGGTSQTPAMAIGQVAPMSYCLGWVRQERTPEPLVWHNGGTSGSRTVLGLMPKSKAAIVVLSNFGESDCAEALMYKFYDMYHGLPDQDYSANFLKSHKARPQPKPVRPSPASPPLPLATYAGTYRHPLFGDLVVTLNGQMLQAKLGTITLKLSPWHRDSFVFGPIMGPTDPNGTAAFEVDPSGKATAVTIDSFAPPGGAFVRVPGK